MDVCINGYLNPLFGRLKKSKILFVIQMYVRLFIVVVLNVKSYFR